MQTRDYHLKQHENSDVLSKHLRGLGGEYERDQLTLRLPGNHDKSQVRKGGLSVNSVHYHARLGTSTRPLRLISVQQIVVLG